MEDELAQRLTHIESHTAHLERQFEQLNQVVIEHGKQLERLQALFQRVTQTMENMELERIRATNPKPPHYQ